jgi:hypothetical protein
VVVSASSPRVAGRALLPDVVAAAPGDRTLYVSYDATLFSGSSVTRQTWIYRLSIADSALTGMRGGVIPGGGYGGVIRSMAVSPDGTKLALTAAGSHSGAGLPDSMDKIIVVDLRTGARSTCQGGLYQGGQTFMIPDVSWTADRSTGFCAAESAGRAPGHRGRGRRAAPG